ncbi:uracil-DNA glycosylase [Streptomyces chattanoogensis]|uniref:Type-5 uracil-DNA glycosylase n=1 Tax=Streptomyces chattanoogensis TaxID=66876 RepID=A0A0N1JW66_9ACTN|nr:uracil-DNA glycosylase [Streptomyces chattanoogensis]KPC60935.1 uracil-DNA glycosylase [Streptomyces chattanoogensis]
MQSPREAGEPPPTTDRAFPAHRAARSGGLDELDAHLIRCRACPRLVAWREEAGRTRRAAFRDWQYWAKPVPGFGPPDAALAVIGLAPAAHGANRTGRMFTGDASGDFLFAALHAVGLASRPGATHRGDGLELYGVRITAPVHCAPPQNKPTPDERTTCRPWLAKELELLAPSLKAVVALGAFGWQTLLPVLQDTGRPLPRPRPAFAHGAHLVLPGPGDGPPLHVLGSYHPSQRNTFTGRLTSAMLIDLLTRAASLAGLNGQGG